MRPKRSWPLGSSSAEAASTPPSAPSHPPSPRPRPRRIRRIPLYFSEPLATHPVHGAGCITYPAEAVIAPQGEEAGRPVVHLLNLPKRPEEMPPGDLQVDPVHLPALRAAGYSCCPMPAATTDAYWQDARARLVTGHWHPKARLVQY
jgi:hypothetical protein